MKRIATAVFSCLVVLGVVGCMLPGTFTAKLDVKKDGSYTFVYDGTVVILPMLADLERGKMDKEAEKKNADEIAGELKKDGKVSNVAYVGKGAFKMSINASGNVKKDPLLVGMKEMPFFVLKLSPDESRVAFHFLAGSDAEKAVKEFGITGYSVSGSIELATELEVESSAGNPDKAWFSSTYTWKVDGLKGEMPAMILKTK